jgi:hypothetical protein
VTADQLALFAEPDDASHACPGGCGRRVARDLFACSPCWYRLPDALRQAIDRTYRPGRFSRDHAQALSAAHHWYHRNPAKGDPR